MAHKLIKLSLLCILLIAIVGFTTVIGTPEEETAADPAKQKDVGDASAGTSLDKPLAEQGIERSTSGKNKDEGGTTEKGRVGGVEAPCACTKEECQCGGPGVCVCKNAPISATACKDCECACNEAAQKKGLLHHVVEKFHAVKNWISEKIPGKKPAAAKEHPPKDEKSSPDQSPKKSPEH